MALQQNFRPYYVPFEHSPTIGETSALSQTARTNTWSPNPGSMSPTVEHKQPRGISKVSAPVELRPNLRPPHLHRPEFTFQINHSKGSWAFVSREGRFAQSQTNFAEPIKGKPLPSGARQRSRELTRTKSLPEDRYQELQPPALARINSCTHKTYKHQARSHTLTSTSYCRGI